MWKEEVDDLWGMDFNLDCLLCRVTGNSRVLRILNLFILLSSSCDVI